MSFPTDHLKPLFTLRRKWIRLVLLQCLLIIGVAGILMSWSGTIHWLSLASVFSLLFFTFLYGNLNLNYDPQVGKLMGELGAGNVLTILRGMLLMLLTGFLFAPRLEGWLAFIPGLLYSTAALADLFDGYLARRSGHQTRLGTQLDLSLDSIGILVASLLLVQYGRVPNWYLVVGLARYLFVGGLWLRRKFGKPEFPLGENSARRPFAGAQMGFAAVVLFPVFSPPGTFLGAALFAVPFLAGFFLDWLTVIGVLSPGLFKMNNPIGKNAGVPGNFVWMVAFKQFVTHWLPVILRVTLVLLIVIWLVGRLTSWLSPSLPTLALLLLNDSPEMQWIPVQLLLMLSGLILIAVGVAGRAAALFVIFALGIYLEYFQLDLIAVLLVLCAVGLFYLGTGPFSLWTPENKVITQRLGEQ